MKKVLVLLLSLMILALGVSGCGNGQQSDAEQPGKTETTKLVVGATAVPHANFGSSQTSTGKREY